MHPISTVKGESFKKLVHTLDKRYALPSWHHFSRMVLPNMYRKCREEVANEESKADDFAATTDLWSSSTMGAISLTLRLIGTEFSLRVRCLKTAFVKCFIEIAEQFDTYLCIIFDLNFLGIFFKCNFKVVRYKVFFFQVMLNKCIMFPNSKIIIEIIVITILTK